MRFNDGRASDASAQASGTSETHASSTQRSSVSHTRLPSQTTFSNSATKASATSSTRASFAWFVSSNDTSTRPSEATTATVAPSHLHRNTNSIIKTVIGELLRLSRRDYKDKEES